MIFKESGPWQARTSASRIEPLLCYFIERYPPVSALATLGLALALRKNPQHPGEAASSGRSVSIFGDLGCRKDAGVAMLAGVCFEPADVPDGIDGPFAPALRLMLDGAPHQRSQKPAQSTAPLRSLSTSQTTRSTEFDWPRNSLMTSLKSSSWANSAALKVDCRRSATDGFSTDLAHCS